MKKPAISACRKSLENFIKIAKRVKNSKTCEKNTKKTTAKKSFKSEI
ncbi:hypothetical protein [Emticicia aquatilis]|nr:hypothetical protein [Emticicia aquatilis]